jgi:serine/threonine protein kinase
MGEVYRATDSHLKRSVAIKVLPAAMAGDKDRLARFQREAEVLAALKSDRLAPWRPRRHRHIGDDRDG